MQRFTAFHEVVNTVFDFWRVLFRLEQGVGRETSLKTAALWPARVAKETLEQ